MSMKVPISYGPKEKMLARLDADPNLKRPAIQLPRMSFELVDINYSSTRKLNTVQKIYAQSEDANYLKYQYVPVPYDFNFVLSIAVKNADDGTRILEQILPFFTPQWTATVNLIPEMGIKLDIPVVLNAVTSEDTYEGDFISRRSLIWTLTFTLKGYIFGPIKEKGVIKIANTNFYDSSPYEDINDSVGSAQVQLNVEITPGLTAGGDPTSNAALSIPASNIEANDNYGYIITKT